MMVSSYDMIDIGDERRMHDPAIKTPEQRLQCAQEFGLTTYSEEERERFFVWSLMALGPPPVRADAAALRSYAEQWCAMREEYFKCDSSAGLPLGSSFDMAMVDFQWWLRNRKTP